MPINAKLVVVGGDVKTAEIKLRLPSTVGRGRGTTIMLPHPLVSRQHCELFESNGQLMVRDLGSLNGTFVNNQRITESPLPPGELLTIGTVTFRAMYEASPDSQPPPGAGPQLKHKRSETDVALPAEVAEAILPVGKTDESDFDFDEPAIPVDEDVAPAANHGTRKMETTLEELPGKTKPAPAPKTTPVPSAKPQQPAKPPPAMSAADKSDPTVDFSKWKDDTEEDEPMKVDEDDDLGEFLKRLGK